MATRVEQSERRRRILELRALKLPAKTIALRTGYSLGYVKNVLSGARKQYAELCGTA